VSGTIDCTKFLGCKTDGDCGDITAKCCAVKGCDGFRCQKAVLQQCTATGYKGMQCLDVETAKTLYPNGIPTEPAVGATPISDTCARCALNSLCSSNGTRCAWTEEFTKCLSVCSIPPDTTTTTPPDPCSALSACKCLSNGCTWCSYEEMYNTKEGTTTTVPLGRCLSKDISNKCSAPRSAAGYEGTLIQELPAECTSTATSDNVKDPSAGITDSGIKVIMETVVSGAVKPEDLQKEIVAAGYGDKVTIKEVCPPLSVDGKMVVRITVTVYDGTLTEQTLRDVLNKVISTGLNLDSKTQIATTDVQAKTTAKKRVTQGDYLQTTTIQSAPPAGSGPQPQQQPQKTPDTSKITGAGGSTITPFWLCTILLALLFLR
jgi:hypothetical protein